MGYVSRGLHTDPEWVAADGGFIASGTSRISEIGKGAHAVECTRRMTIVFATDPPTSEYEPWPPGCDVDAGTVAF